MLKSSLVAPQKGATGGCSRRPDGSGAAQYTEPGHIPPRCSMRAIIVSFCQCRRWC